MCAMRLKLDFCMGFNMKPHIFILICVLGLSGSVLGQVSEIQEFLAEQTQKFSSANHAKAKGLNLEIKVPKSWSVREGNRPNVIQYFKSPQTATQIGLVLMVQDLNLPKNVKLSKKEIREMFLPANLKDFVPEFGEYVESELLTLEGEQGATLIYDLIQERLGVKIFTRTQNYIIYFQGKLIFLQFAATDLIENRNPSVLTFSRNKGLFLLIANSLVIVNKYPK